MSFDLGTQDSTVPRMEALEAATEAWERMGTGYGATMPAGAESRDGRVSKAAGV